MEFNFAFEFGWTHIAMAIFVVALIVALVALFFWRPDFDRDDRILEGHVTTAIEEAEKHLRRAQQNFTRPVAKLADTKAALDVIQRALDSGWEHRKLREMEASLKKSISLMLGVKPEAGQEAEATAPAEAADVAAQPALEPPAREVIRPERPRRRLRDLFRRRGRDAEAGKFQARKPTILLIHADEEERRVVREMIEEIDPAIRTIAVDGARDDVVQLVDDNKVDVILSGIKMGPVNGLQLVAEVKKAYPWVEAILVSWTAYLHKAEAAELGVFACLDKPLVTSAFREALVRCIVERVARNEWRRKGGR